MELVEQRFTRAAFARPRVDTPSVDEAQRTPCGVQRAESTYTSVDWVRRHRRVLPLALPAAAACAPLVRERALIVLRVLTQVAQEVLSRDLAWGVRGGGGCALGPLER